MTEIETHLIDEGSLLTSGNRQYVRPLMSPEDSAYVLSHPDDIKSGDLLVQMKNSNVRSRSIRAVSSTPFGR
jgi:hypothetical protein